MGPLASTATVLIASLLAGGPGPALGQIPDAVPRTEADLVPATRARFQAARAEARRAEEAHALAIRDADAADPGLMFARSFLDRSRRESEAARGPISVIEQRCRAVGPAEVERFRAWQRHFERPIIRERVREVAALGPGARKMTAWIARGLVGLMARQPNLSDGERAALPARPEALTDDEALAAFDRYSEAQMAKATAQGDPPRPPIPLDDADLAAVRRSARAESDLFAANEYVSGLTPESVHEARRRWVEALNRTTLVWPRWAEAERQAASAEQDRIRVRVDQ